MNLKNLNLQELSIKEKVNTNGGFGWLPIAIAIAGATVWCFDKGEQLGTAMAK